MPRYRTLNNDTEINVDGVRVRADDDGTFNVGAGSRKEQVLIAGGVSQVDARLATFATDSAGNTVLVAADGQVIIRPVVSYTWATRPAAASNTGVVIRITDIGGSAGSRWISDGAYWKPESGRVVLGASGEAVLSTAVTAETAYAPQIKIPALCMGPNGVINVVVSSDFSGVDSKIFRIRVGTAAQTAALTGDRLLDTTQTTAVSLRTWTEWQNRNRTDQQVGGSGQSNSILAGGVGAALMTSFINTSFDQWMIFTHAKVTAADNMTLQRYVVELIVP